MCVAMVAAASEKLYFSLVTRGSKLSVPCVAGRRPEDRGGVGSCLCRRGFSPFKFWGVRDFPGSPAVKTLPSTWETQVQILVSEIRSHRWWGATKN